MLAHYRIVEKIGAGGMGEVFRAHDEQLDRDVALKVLPAGTLADEAVRKRFRKEARALAKLNQPNIETVYEFSTQDGVDFLAMELIPGSSLAEKLKEGPLSQKEIIRLGMQFAEGLAAAHDQGVIHRDLKPGNVMITPDGRLKILDFGLARVVHPTGGPDVTRSITLETGTIAGTVPYMAPEQLCGQSVDARSDIYAAGAVLYEMAAGQRPFPQEQSSELIGAILHRTPELPSTRNRFVAPALERVVMKTLEKEPAQRYQSARELLIALEGLRTGQIAPVTGSHWPIVATASAGFAVVLLVGVFLGLNVGGLRNRLLRRGAPGTESAGVSSALIKMRRSVAVLGFKNLSGRTDEAWLSTALSEMLTTELAAGGQLRTIPGEDIAEMKINLSLPDAESYGKETLSRIRQNLGTDTVVLGAYVPLGGGRIRLDLRLQDAVAGQTRAALSEEGSESRLDDLVDRTGEVLRKNLGASAVSPADAETVRASLPSNSEASRFYSEGLEKLRVFNALEARSLLQKAVAADPNAALSHSALAAAWSRLGYDEKAREEAKKAFDLSGKLGREERLVVEGQYRVTMREWDKAIEIYRTLFSFSPDNLDYGLNLADALVKASKGKAALETVSGLRKLPDPASNDPRIDIAEASAARSLGDYRREQNASERAAEKANKLSVRLVVAQARYMQCRAFDELGEPAKAKAACDEAKRISEEAGDRNGVAFVLNTVGVMLFDQGDYSGAMKQFEEAGTVFRDSGNMSGLSGTLNDSAEVLSAEGDHVGAVRMLQMASDLRGEIGDKDGRAGMLANLAGELADQGKLDEAQTKMTEAIAIFRELDDKSGTALWLMNLAEVLDYQGNLAEAEKAAEEALAIDTASGLKQQSGGALEEVASILEAEDRLDESRQQFQAALDIFHEIGSNGYAAIDQMGLAELSLEQGHPAGAETTVRKARAEFQSEKDLDDEFSADSVLIRALLVQGRLSEAQSVFNDAQKFSTQKIAIPAQMDFELASALIQADSKQLTEAQNSMKAILREAIRYGFFGYQLEARLELAETEMKSGKTAAGRAHLAALEKGATAKGFLLIARKARAAAHKVEIAPSF